MSFCNKTGVYPTKLDARLAAARISAKTGERMRTYFCEYHMSWHLTTGRKPGYEKKYRPPKSVSIRKRLLQQRSEKSESRQLRHLREWEDDIPGSYLREDIISEGEERCDHESS